jgi:hypothetical protein
MANNYLLTIPQIADKFRTLGYSKPEPRELRPIQTDSLNPANKEYYDQWRKEGIETAYDGVSSHKNSQMNYLLEKHYPKKSNNRSQAPFQTSTSYNCNNTFSGGSALTTTSKLSDDDFNKYRILLLNRRINDLNGESQPVATPNPPDQYANYNISKIDNNLTLTSLEERILSKVVDLGTYQDLIKIIRFYNNFIFEIDDNQSILDLINRLENIEREVENLKEQRLDLSKKHRHF